MCVVNREHGRKAFNVRDAVESERVTRQVMGRNAVRGVYIHRRGERQGRKQGGRGGKAANTCITWSMKYINMLEHGG